MKYLRFLLKALSVLTLVFASTVAHAEDKKWTHVTIATEGFEAVLAEQALIHGLSFPDDGVHHGRLPATPVISGGFAQMIGWLAIPNCRDIYIPVAWRDLGHGTGCYRYCPEVKLTLEEKPDPDDYRALLDARGYSNWTKDNLGPLLERLNGALDLH